METNSPKLIDPSDVKRMMYRLIIFVVLLVVVGNIALIVGRNIPAKTGDATACNTATGSMTFVLLRNTQECLDETLWRLGMIVLCVMCASWLAVGLSAEKNFSALIRAIFSPDGNESQVWLVGVIAIFLVATVSTVPFYTTQGFLIGVAFRFVRNSLLALVFNFITVRFVCKIPTAEAFLREINALFSNGLPTLIAVTLTIVFYVGKAMLGG